MAAVSIEESDSFLINDKDIGDAFGYGSRNAVSPLPGPIRTAPTERYATHYNMSHPKRGVALIFNHEFFTISHLKPRCGTNVDCENFATTLRNLGFEVNDFHNLTHKDIIKNLERVAEMDHSNHDCLLVAVLSHGELGLLYAHDTPYKAESIWMYFTADKCPSLAGKPKLFFIQACQGDKLDAGISLKERTETDGMSTSTFRIPSHADFLIAYSTIPVNMQISGQSLSTQMKNLENKGKSLESLYENMTDGNQCLGSHQVDTSSDEELTDNRRDDQRDCSCDISRGKCLPNSRFYSWRNTTRGSWFMQALCMEFRENGSRYDILTMLTFVCQRVALDFESNTPDNVHMHQQKQIPCITSMLTRLVKFTQKPTNGVAS